MHIHGAGQNSTQRLSYISHSLQRGKKCLCVLSQYLSTCVAPSFVLKYLLLEELSHSYSLVSYCTVISYTAALDGDIKSISKSGMGHTCAESIHRRHCNVPTSKRGRGTKLRRVKHFLSIHKGANARHKISSQADRSHLHLSKETFINTKCT